MLYAETCTRRTAIIVVCIAFTTAVCQDTTTTTDATSSSATLPPQQPPPSPGTTLPPVTPVPRPFEAGTTPPPETLSADDLQEAAFVHKSFSWSDIARFRQRIVNKWWISVIVLPTAGLVMLGVANLQRALDRSSDRNTQDFVEYLSRNIAAATIISGTLGMMSYTRLDEEDETNLELRSVRWALLVAWSYHTIFLFTILYSALLAGLYVLLSRVLVRWSTWESGLSRDPEHAPDSSVDHDLNLMILVRKLFYLQLRLSFPNVDFRSAFSVQVTKYLRVKEREMVEELASFSRWSDWLVMVVFVIINGMRMAAVSQGAVEVTDKMRLDDGLTFAFAVGFLPSLAFFVIYRRLKAGLWRFLRTSIVAAQKRLEKRQRQRDLRLSRLKIAGRVLTDADFREGDGTTLYMDASVLPALPDPGRFVPFGSTRTISATWRAAIVLNALYLAVLATALGYVLAVKVSGGPAVMLCCCLPTVGLLYMLPWSTAAVVVVRNLGRNIDLQEALLSFADPEQERLRMESKQDTLRGPSPRHDEGDDPDRLLHVDILDKIDLDPPAGLATDGVAPVKVGGDKTPAAVQPPRRRSASTAGHGNAPADRSLQHHGMEDAGPVSGVPLALSSSHSEKYQRNIHHVNERLLELKRYEAELHGAVVRASYRRRKVQEQLEEFVNAISRRPDLGPQWREAVELAKSEAEDARKSSGSEYERRLADLEARQRATIAAAGREGTNAFSFHDVFQEELLKEQATLEERMVHTSSIPSLAHVYEAIGPTVDEAKPQLPWRKIPQLDTSDAGASSRRWLNDSLDITVEAARRQRRRALRNAKRSKFDEAELQRLEGQGITRRDLKRWDDALQSSGSSGDDQALENAALTLMPTEEDAAGGRRPPSAAATELERVQDLDPKYWGLTEEQIQMLKQPAAAPPPPPTNDLGLDKWRAEQRRNRREQAIAEGRDPDSADTPGPRASANPMDGQSVVSEVHRPVAFDLDSQAPTDAATSRGESRASRPATNPDAGEPDAVTEDLSTAVDVPADTATIATSVPSEAVTGVSAATSGARSVMRHLRQAAGAGDAAYDPEDDPDL